MIYAIAYLLVSKYICVLMDTRTAILDIGEALIRSKGYHSFSYKDIAQQLKVKNAAIHYHFTSKSDLGVAILDKAIAHVHISSKKWKSLPEDEQFKKFLHTYFESHTRGMVCLMGALSASYETLPAEMQAKLQKMGEVILEWLTGCLAEGKRKKIFHFEEKPDVKATMLVSNMLSSLLLSRALGKKYFSTIHRQVLASV